LHQRMGAFINHPDFLRVGMDLGSEPINLAQSAREIVTRRIADVVLHDIARARTPCGIAHDQDEARWLMEPGCDQDIDQMRSRQQSVAERDASARRHTPSLRVVAYDEHLVIDHGAQRSRAGCRPVVGMPLDSPVGRIDGDAVNTVSLGDQAGFQCG